MASSHVMTPKINIVPPFFFHHSGTSPVLFAKSLLHLLHTVSKRVYTQLPFGNKQVQFDDGDTFYNYSRVTILKLLYQKKLASVCNRIWQRASVM